MLAMCPCHPPITRNVSILLQQWQRNDSQSCLTGINALSGNYDAASRLAHFMYHRFYINDGISYHTLLWILSISSSLCLVVHHPSGTVRGHGYWINNWTYLLNHMHCVQFILCEFVCCWFFVCVCMCVYHSCPALFRNYDLMACWINLD